MKRLASTPAEAGLFLWGAVQVFYALSDQDGFVVVFSLDPATLSWVTVLWVKNLAASLACGFLLVALLRATGRVDVVPTGEAVPRKPATLFWGGVIVLVVAGTALRWMLPQDLPPGLWCDVAYEAEEALRDPSPASLWGGIPLGLDGSASHVLVSNLYLGFCRLSLHAFGQGEAGLRAISALPSSLVPLTGFVAASLAWGWSRGFVALALLSLMRWPLIFSFWTWTGSALLALSAAALAAACAGLRHGKASWAAVSGVFTGLSLHTHPASWAGACGLALFAAGQTRTRPGRRLAMAAVVGTLLGAGPFLAAYFQYPSYLGGRTRDVPVTSSARLVGLTQSVGLRLLDNAVNYTGFFLLTKDPNPRHNIPGRASMHPLLGLALAIGVARAVQASHDPVNRLLLFFVGGGLLAGILSNPGGSPNTTRIVPLLLPLLLLATGPLVAWSLALAAILKVRVGLIALLGVTLLAAFESGPVLERWPTNPLVAQYFLPEETIFGRIRLSLAPFPTVVEPGAIRHPIVFESCAASRRPVAPLPRFPRRSAAALRAAPPDGPFWYLARPAALQDLRASGFRVSRGTSAVAGSAPLLAWVNPPGPGV